MAERLVVIGGDAAGMSAASQARRRRDDLEIVALERGTWTSYSSCGLPYVVAGDVDDLQELVVRDPKTFRDEYRIDVRLEHEATAIDVDAGEVEVHDRQHGRTFRLGFDQLMIGTGGRPFRPDLPGMDLEFVQGVQTVGDVERLLAFAERSDVRRVVVVGGGYIGLEMADAFTLWGADVTVVDRAPEVMGTLDPDMGALVTEAMRRHEIDVLTSTTVTGFETGRVLLGTGELEADLVVLGIGVQPNSELASEAGLSTGVSGAITVDRQQRTSASGIWAGGDCCESHHLITGMPTHLALGTIANRQGRVAGINIGGGYATFPGIVGTAATKVCSAEISRTGLTEIEATDAGFEAVVARIGSTTRAGYFPGARPITVKLVAERGTGRLLGGQIVGGEGAAKRIDVLAAAITAGMTAHEMIDLDLAYAPPFSPLWDPVVVAARRAARALDDDAG